jgi:hypothetical protein
LPVVRAAAATTLLAALALVAMLAGCGSDDGASASGSSAGPRAFADESYAELATDGREGLWLAVSGYQRDGDFGLRVFKREGSDWSELPTPPGEVSGDIPISLAIADNEGEPAPCLGYSVGVKWKATIACFEGDEWQRKDLPGLRNGQLQQIASEDGDLVGLIAERSGTQTRYRLLQEAGAEWTLTPPVTTPAAVARLAIDSPEGSDERPPAIGLVTQGQRSQHYVLELRGKRWRKLRPAIRGVGTGPLVGGPIVLPQRVLYPVIEANEEPWSFSVQSARLGSSKVKEVPLSTGRGNAQGQLHLLGDAVWATWQEDDPRKDGRFHASIYAAELDPTGRVRRKIQLWQGLSIGPGSTQVIEFEGRTVALYMRSSSNGRGLQATIRNLPSKPSA